MAQLTQARPPSPLGELLAAVGMRPEQLIARINEHRGRRGSPPLDPKSAYPWLRKNSPARPNTENETDALAVLSIRAGRSVTGAELGWTGPRRKAVQRPLQNPGDARAADLLHEITQGETMDRRDFLLLTGSAVTAPGLSTLLEGGSRSLPAAADSHRLPPQIVGSIEHSIRELRDLDDAEGGAAGLVWAGGLWQSVSRVIVNSRYSARDGRRLHTAFVELSELYGWMLFDADRHPQAQRVYQTGLSVSRESDQCRATDLATRNLLASTAYQAAWLGQHTEARTLLDIAGHRPADLPPSLRAVLADREIFTAGRCGDTDSLRRARDTAHDQLQLTGAEAPWWAEWISPQAIDAATGRAWLAADDPKAARPYLANRLDSLQDDYPRDRMLATLDLADAHRRSGDLDAASLFARQAGLLAYQVDSPRARIRLREVTSPLSV